MSEVSKEALEMARLSVPELLVEGVAFALQKLMDERDFATASRDAYVSSQQFERRRAEAAERKLAELVREVRAYQTGESKRRLTDILDKYEGGS